MKRLASWLRHLADRLDPPVVVPVPVSPLSVYEQAALVLINDQQARWPDRSGEAKRHQVLARLLKDFPSARERDLAFAIETMIQRSA